MPVEKIHISYTHGDEVYNYILESSYVPPTLPKIYYFSDFIDYSIDGLQTDYKSLEGCAQAKFRIPQDKIPLNTDEILQFTTYVFSNKIEMNQVVKNYLEKVYNKVYNKPRSFKDVEIDIIVSKIIPNLFFPDTFELTLVINILSNNLMPLDLYNIIIDFLLLKLKPQLNAEHF